MKSSTIACVCYIFLVCQSSVYGANDEDEEITDFFNYQIRGKPYYIPQEKALLKIKNSNQFKNNEDVRDTKNNEHENDELFELNEIILSADNKSKQVKSSSSKLPQEQTEALVRLQNTQTPGQRERSGQPGQPGLSGDIRPAGPPGPQDPQGKMGPLGLRGLLAPGSIASKQKIKNLPIFSSYDFMGYNSLITPGYVPVAYSDPKFGQSLTESVSTQMKEKIDRTPKCLSLGGVKNANPVKKRLPNAYRLKKNGLQVKQKEKLATSKLSRRKALSREELMAEIIKNVKRTESLVMEKYLFIEEVKRVIKRWNQRRKDRAGKRMLSRNRDTVFEFQF